MADTKEKDLAQEELDADTIFNQAVSGTPLTEADDTSTPDKDSKTDADDEADSPDEQEENLDQADDEDEQEQDEQSEQEDDQTPADNEDSQDDIFAGLTEAQLTHIQNMQNENIRMQNNVRANSERVSALNRKLKELTEQQSQTGQSEGEGKQDDVSDSLKLKGKNFQEVEEEWPEVANYVRAQVEQAVTMTQQAMRKELDPLRQQYDALEHERQVSSTQTEIERLSSAHPDFAQVNSSPEFSSWLTNKPVSIQNLYGSMSADDNIELLNLYKFEKGLAKPAAPQVKPQGSKRDLSEHAELPRKGTLRPQAMPVDSEELFDTIVANKQYKP